MGTEEGGGLVCTGLGGGDGGRGAERGAGVQHKERAMEFGFSGATPEALREIRGVGAGLGIARAAAAKVGGSVTIEDNIGGGTVATIFVPGGEGSAGGQDSAAKSPPQRRYPGGVPRMNISERQQKVL